MKLQAHGRSRHLQILEIKGGKRISLLPEDRHPPSSGHNFLQDLEFLPA